MITIPAVNGKHTKKSPRYYITDRCRSLFSLLYWRLRGAEIRQVNGVFTAYLINFHLHSICMSKLANWGTKPALTDDVTKKYRMNVCNEQRLRWQMPAIETASTKQKKYGHHEIRKFTNIYCKEGRKIDGDINPCNAVWSTRQRHQYSLRGVNECIPGCLVFFNTPNCNHVT